MTNEVIIRVENLWKQYGLPLPEIIKRFKRGIGRSGLSSKVINHWALRNISFEVRKGEMLGIIGLNGAGKSTLLKVLAGVTPATKGKVDVKGKIFPMIELNAGIHPELTGRENVRLLGAIMGFSRQEIEARIPQIERFTELGEWFYQPVRKYSSGMLARLGFGVAMNVDAEVLLIDEVLAVGDLAFQRKCYERIEKLKDAETTIVLVSHNIRQVARLCEPVMVMEKGEIIETGTGVRITSLYYERCTEKTASHISTGAKKEGAFIETTGELLIQSVTVLDETGCENEQLRSGDVVIFRLEYLAKVCIEQPIISVGILTPDMLVVGGISNVEIERPNLKGRGWIDCKISNLPLLPGIFYVNVNITHKNGARLFKGRNLNCFHIIPRDQKGSYLKGTGLVAFDAEWIFHK